MDKLKKEAIKKHTMLPCLVAMIAALVMVVCVFLPYATATEERAEWIDKYPDSIALEEMDLTAADMKNISMAKFAHIYSAMSEEYWGDPLAGVFYIVLVALIGGGALVAAMFALGRKPIGCIIFGAMSFGVFRMLNWDFTDRGVIPSDSYDWGIAHTIFLIAAALMLIGAVWMFAKKILLKKQFRVATSAQVTETTE